MNCLSDEYLAGLFDGEGWFQIDRSMRKGCKSPSFQVHARICMRDHALLLALREKYGGSFRMSAKATDRRAAYWSWDNCGSGAAKLAQVLLPLLNLKHKQAALTIEFQQYKSQGTNQPNSEARVAQLGAFYTQMRLLNQKGVSR